MLFLKWTSACPWVPGVTLYYFMKYQVQVIKIKSIEVYYRRVIQKNLKLSILNLDGLSNNFYGYPKPSDLILTLNTSE